MATAKEIEQGILKASRFLKAYASKLTRDRETAQDLYQETVCKALERADQFTMGTNLEAWLTVIMANLHKNWAKLRGRYDQLFNQDVAVRQDFDSAMTLERVAGELEKLPKGWGEQLIENLVDGKTYSEIARDMGKPVNTVKTQIFRTREKLRKELEDVI